MPFNSEAFLRRAEHGGEMLVGLSRPSEWLHRVMGNCIARGAAVWAASAAQVDVSGLAEGDCSHGPGPSGPDFRPM